MKQVLIIFYDLADPASNREAITQKIKAYGSWARLGSSAYLIGTDATPVHVRDNLAKVLNADDRVFVGVCRAPSAWEGMPEEISKWILKNQM